MSSEEVKVEETAARSCSKLETMEVIEPHSDIVCNLLETPFSDYSEADKDAIVFGGRPTPSLDIITMEKNRSRSFNTSWYDSNPWLCASTYKQRLFCWPCILFSSCKNAWSYEGYKDFKNLSRSLRIHDNSKEHINCYLSLKRMEQSANPVASALEESCDLAKNIFNENVRKNRLILKYLIDATILIGMKESYRDEIEVILNNSRFFEVFNVFIKRNMDLMEHTRKLEGIFKEHLTDIYYQLIQCIEEHLIEYIKKEVLATSFFSIHVSDISDIVEKPHCSVMLRYVNENADIIERFMGFYDMNREHSVDFLFLLISNILEPFNIEEKLIAQSYDGASFTIDEINDLECRIKGIARYALLFNSFVRKFNSVLKQGSCCIERVKLFFATIDSVAVYFQRSPKCRGILMEQINKEISDDCCNCVNLLLENFDDVIRVLRTIESDRNSGPESIIGAKNFLEIINKFEFKFLLATFNEIFNITDKFDEEIQSKCLDVKHCVNHIHTALLKLEKLKRDDVFTKIYNNASKNYDMTPPNGKISVKDVKLYYKNLYVQILNNIISQINTRFSNFQNLVFLTLVDFSRAKKFHSNFPESEYKSVQNFFPQIFETNRLKNELSIIYSESSFRKLDVVPAMKYLIKNDYKDIFPEVYKFLSLVATLPLINTETDTSCFKRIEAYLKSSTIQDNTLVLGLIYIERELLMQLSQSDNFYDDVINKFDSIRQCNIDLSLKN